jgi:hypothetical protein
MSTDTKGPPLFGLPAGGVAFGALWIAGAFSALLGCFISNYRNTAPNLTDELAISNAALAHGEAHAAAPPAQP